MSAKIVKDEKIILGIDPGTNLMGFGVITATGSHLKLLQYGIIHLSKYDANDHALKLKKIFDKVSQLLEEYIPDYMAIEAPFYGKNIQSMLKLGRAQGVALGPALQRGIPVVEYAPKKIKQSVTGNGNASKEQVAAMLMQMFNIKQMPDFLDATDALAVAVCHHFQAKGVFSKQNTSWKSFIADNPNRVER